MASRLELHEKLCELLGSRNVYFHQPPESVKMRYPAIVYSRDMFQEYYANDGNYISKTRYRLVAITDDPDSELINELKSLPLCKYVSYYASDNLNHDVFYIYY